MRTIKRKIVGGFIFSSDNKVLLGLSISGGVYTDKWIVPGGGMEEGETLLDTLKREMLEETGIDVTIGEIIKVEGSLKGQSEKTLRDSGEKVLVDMTFYDYIVNLPAKAVDIKLSSDDDLTNLSWFSAKELNNISVSTPTKTGLKNIGFIK